MKHNICDNEFQTTPDTFLNKKRRCPICSIEKRSKKHTLTHEEFLSKLPLDTYKNYEILSKYTKRKDDIEVLCKRCNTKFKLSADEFLRGNGCPKCRISNGEKKISEWLDEHNYSYIWHYKGLKNCKNKRVLEFDFKLNVSDDKFILLEYDGEFHNKSIYGKEELDEQIKRDHIKDDYCKKNNIELYRISYKDFDNIETILETILSKY